MTKTLTTITALLAATGIGIAISQPSFAQPKEGCGVELSEEVRAAMEGSERGSGAPDTGVGGPEVGDEQHAAMEGSTEGSAAPMPGRGECDEVDELPQTRTEG